MGFRGGGESRERPQRRFRLAARILPDAGQTRSSRTAQVDRRLSSCARISDRLASSRAPQAYVRIPRPIVTFGCRAVRRLPGLNPKRFARCGNYTIGIKEHMIFPRDRLRPRRSRLLWEDIVVCTTAKRNDEEARAFGCGFQFPRSGSEGLSELPSKRGGNPGDAECEGQFNREEKDGDAAREAVSIRGAVRA